MPSRPEKKSKGRPASYRNVNAIKAALAPFVKGHRFCSYTTDRDITAIDADVLASRRYMLMIKRMFKLSASWNFLPIAITQCLVSISKAGPTASPYNVFGRY